MRGIRCSRKFTGLDDSNGLPATDLEANQHQQSCHDNVAGAGQPQPFQFSIIVFAYQPCGQHHDQPAAGKRQQHGEQSVTGASQCGRKDDGQCIEDRIDGDEAEQDFGLCCQWSDIRSAVTGEDEERVECGAGKQDQQHARATRPEHSQRGCLPGCAACQSDVPGSHVVPDKRLNGGTKAKQWYKNQAVDTE